MTPRELESLLHFGKKAINWLFVLVVAGYILWAVARPLAILTFILLGIFVLFVAHEGWKAHRRMRPASATTPDRNDDGTVHPIASTGSDSAPEHRD